MCSSKTAYEGVASCWRSPGYLLTETFELLLCTFVILDHRCLACVIIQQSSHLMRKMSSILLSTIKAVKNISAICNVPSAAASMNLTGNNMKFTVEHIFKKWKLVRLPLAFTKPPLKAAQTTPQSHGRTPHLDSYSTLPADLLTFCVFPIRLPRCCQNYLLNLRPGYMSHYLKALCGIPSPHHCQLECSVTQPPAPGCPPAPTGLILSRLGHWLRTEVTIPLPTLHVVSEGPCFSPLFCVATPMCPTTLTSNVTCSVIPAHRLNWPSVCAQEEICITSTGRLITWDPNALLPASSVQLWAALLHGQHCITVAPSAQPCPADPSPDSTMAVLHVDLDDKTPCGRGRNKWGFLPRSLLFDFGDTKSCHQAGCVYFSVCPLYFSSFSPWTK